MHQTKTPQQNLYIEPIPSYFWSLSWFVATSTTRVSHLFNITSNEFYPYKIRRHEERRLPRFTEYSNEFVCFVLVESGDGTDLVSLTSAYPVTIVTCLKMMCRYRLLHVSHYFLPATTPNLVSHYSSVLLLTVITHPTLVGLLSS